MALLLWQPVLDGKTHLTQFMRVRIAAAMDRPELTKETTATMRQTWAEGGTVEIAGYEIHAALATALEAAGLTRHTLAVGTSALWLEQAGTEEGMSQGSARALNSWHGKPSLLATRTYQGPAFWQVHERMLAPDAVVQTTTWFESMGCAN